MGHYNIVNSIDRHFCWYGYTVIVYDLQYVEMLKFVGSTQQNLLGPVHEATCIN